MGFCSILRTAATLDTLAPLAALALAQDPAAQQRLHDYQDAARGNQSYGFCAVRTDQQAMEMEAGGIFAVIAGAIALGKAVDGQTLIEAVQ